MHPHSSSSHPSDTTPLSPTGHHQPAITTWSTVLAIAAAAGIPEVSELVTDGTPRVVVVMGTYLEGHLVWRREGVVIEATGARLGMDTRARVNSRKGGWDSVCEHM